MGRWQFQSRWAPGKQRSAAQHLGLSEGKLPHCTQLGFSRPNLGQTSWVTSVSLVAVPSGYVHVHVALQEELFLLLCKPCCMQMCTTCLDLHVAWHMKCDETVEMGWSFPACADFGRLPCGAICWWDHALCSRRRVSVALYCSR